MGLIAQMKEHCTDVAGIRLENFRFPFVTAQKTLINNSDDHDQIVSLRSSNVYDFHVLTFVRIKI